MRIRSTIRSTSTPAAIAFAVVVVLVVLAPRYGWHRDELYFLQCGRRLSWAYVDQPPLTPALARLVDEVFGPSLLALRAMAAFAIGGVVYLAGSLARHLGGDSRAIVFAAIVAATVPLFLGMGHLFSTATFDLLAWTVILWLVVRLLRTGDTRWWVGIGVAFGVGALNKHTVVFLAVGLAAGFLLTPARRLLVTRWLAAGVMVAAVLVAPNLWWHATHGWPVVAMMRSLSAESGVEDHALFVPAQIGQVGPAVVVALVGLRSLWKGRSPVAFAYLVLVAVFVVTAGKPYYLAGMYPVLLAAGAAQWSARRMSTRAIAAIAVAGAVLSLAVALPMAPAEWHRSNPIEDLEYEVGAQLGWPEMVDVVARVAGPHRDVAVYAQNYGEAGALDLYGRARGLPPAASPHNHYWWWGPPKEADVTIVVGVPDGALPDLRFGRCERVHTLAAVHGVLSEEAGRAVHVCRDHQRRWSDLWDGLRLYSA